MTDPSYPEHEKLLARPAEHETIVAFLNWLNDQGYTVCNFNKGWEHSHYQPINGNEASLVAGFFGVDEKALEKEKREILRALRATQNAKDAHA